MGKVHTDIKISSFKDLLDSEEKRIKPDEIRQIALENVIVDSGATMLCLSKKLIDQLGLSLLRIIKVNTADAIVERGIFGPVSYEIKGRCATGEVMELHHPKIHALIGQIPLEQLDFLINPAANTLITNFEHDGQLILDQLIVTEDLKFEVIN